MKTIFDHIEHVKGKPHHIRQRVAFGAAAGVTAVIAVVWLAGSLTTGAFALQESSFGEQSPAVVTADTSSLAGAAAALPNVGDSSPARIEIIDAVGVEQKKSVEQTTLPF